MARPPTALAGQRNDSITCTPTIQKADVNFSGSPHASATPVKNNSTAYDKTVFTDSAAEKKITWTVNKVQANSPDLQASAFGHTNIPLSSIAVPIRLDALSYLLNSALMGAYRIASQTPLYGNQHAIPLCQNPAPLYHDPMAQVAQTSAIGNGSHPAHCTSPVFSAPQSYPVQQHVFIGNSYPNLARSLVSPTNNPKDNTIVYSPVVQGEAHSLARNASAACCIPKQISMNLVEGNTSNKKQNESIMERQKNNFFQPNVSFSLVNKGQNPFPKTGFVKSSLGNWENDRRGNSSPGYQLKRSKELFHPGIWRENSRNKSGDPSLEERRWSCNFHKRKRTKNTRSWLQDESRGTKRKRRSRRRRHGGGQGSRSQRFYDSQARSELANVSKKSKPVSDLKSRFSLPPSFSKKCNSGEALETDYEQGQPKMFGPSTNKSSVSVDKWSTVTATSKAFQSISFAKNDNLRPACETECKSEASSTSTSKWSFAQSQKQVHLKPKLSNRNTKSLEVVSETSLSHNLDEKSKATEREENQDKVVDKCSTPESNIVEDPEKGLFEKFMATFYSEAAMKNEGVNRSTANVDIQPK